MRCRCRWRRRWWAPRRGRGRHTGRWRRPFHCPYFADAEGYRLEEGLNESFRSPLCLLLAPVPVDGVFVQTNGVRRNPYFFVSRVACFGSCARKCQPSPHREN